MLPLHQIIGPIMRNALIQEDNFSMSQIQKGRTWIPDGAVFINYNGYF